jgi:hypothetical protein
MEDKLTDYKNVDPGRTDTTPTSLEANDQDASHSALEQVTTLLMDRAVTIYPVPYANFEQPVVMTRHEPSPYWANMIA